MPISLFEFFSAFLAGLATFFSPCVLPLIPAYLSLISGLGAAELLREGGPEAANRPRVLVSAGLFVGGFSAAFILLGSTASAAGLFFARHGRAVELVSGSMLIFFGAYLMGLFNAAFLNYEKRLPLHKLKPGYWGAFLMGFAFAFGWTPCIGPVLAALLALAASGNTAVRGAALLFFYSLGLGLPFIAAAFGARKLMALVASHRRLLSYGERFAGVIFVLIGVLLLISGKTPFLRSVVPV